jgi:hypothetical protein
MWIRYLFSFSICRRIMNQKKQSIKVTSIFYWTEAIVFLWSIERNTWKKVLKCKHWHYTHARTYPRARARARACVYFYSNAHLNLFNMAFSWDESITQHRIVVYNCITYQISHAENIRVVTNKRWMSIRYITQLQRRRKHICCQV